MDPGGVRTSIWDEVPLLAAPPARWVIEALYAPPADGAEILVRAATMPWEQVCGEPGGSWGAAVVKAHVALCCLSTCQQLLKFSTCRGLS